MFKISITFTQRLLRIETFLYVFSRSYLFPFWEKCTQRKVDLVSEELVQFGIVSSLSVFSL